MQGLINGWTAAGGKIGINGMLAELACFTLSRLIVDSLKMLLVESYGATLSCMATDVIGISITQYLDQRVHPFAAELRQ